jgi:cytochrome b561
MTKINWPDRPSGILLDATAASFHHWLPGDRTLVRMLPKSMR